VATGLTRPATPEEDAIHFAAPGDDELLAWFRAGHRALVQTLSSADPAVTCWSFLPAPSPLACWARRQAHETAIHRVDAESALGAIPDDWSAAFAADGLDELFTGFFGRKRGRLVADPPVRLAVAASDVELAWTMHIEPDGRRVVPGRHPAELTVSGPANDLYLLFWNRRGLDGVLAEGDLGILELWRSKATVTWS
jgi:uncharacterized protein (TIGR03083 family)